MLNEDHNKTLNFDYQEIIKRFQSLQYPLSSYLNLLTQNGFDFSKNTCYDNGGQEKLIQSKISEYPERVIKHAERAKQRVYFGILEDIQMVYCIVDHKLFLWKDPITDSQLDNLSFSKKNISPSDSIHLKSSSLIKLKFNYPITVVTTTHADHKVFTKHVKNVITVGTTNSIHFIPVVDQCIQSNRETWKECETDFPITSITGTYRGIIYVGTLYGDIYSIFIRIDNLLSDPSKEIKVFPKTSSWVVRKALEKGPILFSDNNAIVSLTYSESAKILAGVLGNGDVKFWQEVITDIPEENGGTQLQQMSLELLWEQNKVNIFSQYWRKCLASLGIRAVHENISQASSVDNLAKKTEDDKIEKLKEEKKKELKNKRGFIFTSISAVERNGGSSGIYFVGFGWNDDIEIDQDGINAVQKRFADRIFFSLRGDVVTAVALRRFPIGNYDENGNCDDSVVGGGFAFNTSVTFTEKLLAVEKSSATPFNAQQNPLESKSEISFQNKDGERLLNVYVSKAKEAGAQTEKYENEFSWQHGSNGPGIWYLTNYGVYRLWCIRPVDTLSKILTDANGNYNNNVRQWMIQNPQNFGDECPSTAVLLAIEQYIKSEKSDTEGKEKQKMKWALYILSQYVLETTKFRDETSIDNQLSIGAKPFLIATMRVIDGILHTGLMRKDAITNKWKITKEWTESDYEERLSAIVFLIEEFIKLRRIDDPNADVEQTLERKQLKSLQAAIKILIEMVRFASIIGKEKNSYISSIFQSIPPDDQRILSLSGISHPSFFQSLRQLSTHFAISSGKSRITNQFAQQCPSLFSLQDIELVSAVEALKSMPQNSEEIEDIHQTILRHIHRSLNLKEIVSGFAAIRSFQNAADIVLRYATAGDPGQKALLWFKAGNNQNDEEGILAFNNRYACYEELFYLTEDQEALSAMLQISSIDEMFQLVLYDYLDEHGKLRQILDLNIPLSPFLEHYLETRLNTKKSNNTIELWEFYYKRRDYAKSADELLNKAKAQSNDTGAQRAAWLSIVAEYYKASHQIQNSLDVLKLMKRAELQNMVEKARDKVYGRLVEKQELFDDACGMGEWKIVLELLADEKMENRDKRRKVIDRAWINYLTENLGNCSLSIAADEIQQLLQRIPDDSDVKDPQLILPALEDYRIKNDADVAWVPNLLGKGTVKWQTIEDGYLSMIKNATNLSKNLKIEFIYCASIAAINHIKNLTINESIDEKQKRIQLYTEHFNWIKQNGIENPLYNKVFKNLSILTK